MIFIIRLICIFISVYSLSSNLAFSETLPGKIKYTSSTESFLHYSDIPDEFIEHIYSTQTFDEYVEDSFKWAHKKSIFSKWYGSPSYYKTFMEKLGNDHQSIVLRYDTDGNGILTLDETRANKPKNPQALEQLSADISFLRALDTDQDKVISIKEAKIKPSAYIEKIRAEYAERHKTALFIDKNKDDVVSDAEFLDVAVKAFAKIDLDKNAIISIDEIQNLSKYTSIGVLSHKRPEKVVSYDRPTIEEIIKITNNLQTKYKDQGLTVKSQGNSIQFSSDKKMMTMEDYQNVVDTLKSTTNYRIDLRRLCIGRFCNNGGIFFKLEHPLKPIPDNTEKLLNDIGTLIKYLETHNIDWAKLSLNAEKKEMLIEVPVDQSGLLNFLITQPLILTKEGYAEYPLKESWLEDIQP